MTILDAGGHAIGGYNYLGPYSDPQVTARDGIQWNGMVYAVGTYPATVLPYTAAHKSALFNCAANTWRTYTEGRFDWPTVN